MVASTKRPENAGQLLMDTEEVLKRKLIILGTHHEFQLDDPMDSSFHSTLAYWIQHNKVDTIFEEATTWTPATKLCVQQLADELGLKWKNVDLTIEERKSLTDKSVDEVYDFEFYDYRERVWGDRILEAPSKSGLLVCGLGHMFSMAQKLKDVCDVTTILYDPRRIYDWQGRPRRVPPVK